MSFLSQPFSISAILFGNKRMLADFDDYVVVTEDTNDTLTITKQPVQQGAAITDHAYKEPTTFNCSILMKADLQNSLKDLYQKFLDLQISRVPFDIVTPKRLYSNMMIAVLAQNTDKYTENCLSIRLSCQEVIIVSVNTVQVPRSSQRNAGATGKTEKVGRKSALNTLFGRFGG